MGLPVICFWHGYAIKLHTAGVYWLCAHSNGGWAKYGYATLVVPHQSPAANTHQQKPTKARSAINQPARTCVTI